MGRTTIKDIAQMANVSIATVSHALNGSRPVSPATRARVQELARLMAYRPDPVARMLKGQDSLLIGHIVSTLHSNLFHALVARGADRRAQEAGYATLISFTEEDPQAERRAVDLLLEKRVNGIIFTTPHRAENVERAVAAGVAAVMVERPLPVPGAHSVVVDQRKGMRELTAILIEEGHRQIAYIGGGFSSIGSDLVERTRLRGFRDAMKAAGLPVAPSQVQLVAYSAEAAHAAGERLLRASPRPTALVVGSDLLVAGILQVLYRRCIRVPDDLSVVSFDDTLGPQMAPALTEVEPLDEEMGRQAVDLIVEHYRQPVSDRGADGRRIVLEPRLHRRGSTRPLDDAGAAEDAGH